MTRPDIPLRFWRLSESEFQELSQFLNRWSNENVRILEALVVNNEMQATVANRYNKSSQTVHCLLKRGLKIYYDSKEFKKSLSKRDSMSLLE